MSNYHTRAIARVVAGQLAEQAGYQSVQESAVEVLAELLLRYTTEVATSSHAYAELANRSDMNVSDVLLALEDMNTTVDNLRDYASRLSSVSPWAVGRPA